MQPELDSTSRPLCLTLPTGVHHPAQLQTQLLRRQSLTDFIKLGLYIT